MTQENGVHMAEIISVPGGWNVELCQLDKETQAWKQEYHFFTSNWADVTRFLTSYLKKRRK